MVSNDGQYRVSGMVAGEVLQLERQRPAYPAIQENQETESAVMTIVC
jgi:hypothetical protein